MESPDNILFRCEKHRSQVDPQYADKPFHWFVGKFCKLSFDVSDHPTVKHELMWVQVEQVKVVDGVTLLIGQLNNDPIFVDGYKCGDGVGFERNEIHVVYDPNPA